MERDTQDMDAFYSRLVKEELRYFEESHKLNSRLAEIISKISIAALLPRLFSRQRAAVTWSILLGHVRTRVLLLHAPRNILRSAHPLPTFVDGCLQDQGGIDHIFLWSSETYDFPSPPSCCQDVSGASCVPAGL